MLCLNYVNKIKTLLLGTEISSFSIEQMLKTLELSKLTLNLIILFYIIHKNTLFYIIK